MEAFKERNQRGSEEEGLRLSGADVSPPQPLPCPRRSRGNQETLSKETQ